MDERPVSLKKQKPDYHLDTECIVHYNSVKDDKCTQLTSKSLSAIQNAAELRQSLGCTDYERQNNICQNLPSTVHQHHGYHRQ